MTIVLSRYTRDGYEDSAKRLADSCRRFNLRSSIEVVDTMGSWLDTVKQKPLWILSSLLAWREPVLWIDADCEVIKFPDLLYCHGADFSAYNWKADAESGKPMSYDPSQLEVSGGVMLFGYTAAAIELLIRWDRACQQNCSPQGTDPMLSLVFNDKRPPLQIAWLPKSYNRHEKMWPDVEPVINHDYRTGAHKLPSMFHYADVYDEAVETAVEGARFVEIGCWLGDSSSYMAGLIKDSGKSINFWCVDTWKGSEGVAWMEPMVADAGGDMLPAWNSRMERDGVRDWACPLQEPSAEAAASFVDGSLDFVFGQCALSSSSRFALGLCANENSRGVDLAGRDRTAEEDGSPGRT